MNMDNAQKYLRLQAPRRAVAALACLLLASCIERSNPFDPLNARGRTAETIRAGNQAKLDALATKRAEYAGFLKEYQDRFALDSTANAVISAKNDSVGITNLATDQANAEIVTFNTSLPESLYAQLRNKSEYIRMEFLVEFGPDSDFKEHRARLQALASEISAFMSDVNSRNSPTDVYPQSIRDSIFRPIALDTLAFSLLAARIDSGNAAVNDGNLAIRADIIKRDEDNGKVTEYNATIDFLRRSRGNKVIVRADSLDAATKVAKAGDTLFLGPGIYDVELRFMNSGIEGNPIVVRGHPAKTTVLRALNPTTKGSAVMLENRSEIHFEDLVFRKGGTSGVKLENGSRKIVFQRCLFDSSGTWGVEAVDSDLGMENCIVRNNGGGIRVTGVQGGVNVLTLVNNLIVQNQGKGLESLSTGVSIRNCTFAGNAGEGIYILSPVRPIFISATIVSANKLAGIWREPTTWVPGSLTVEYSDVWGNDPVDWNLSGITPEQAAEVMASNYNIVPEFVDPANFDYSLKAGSKLSDYEANPPHLKIGYRP